MNNLCNFVIQCTIGHKPANTDHIYIQFSLFYKCDEKVFPNLPSFRIFNFFIFTKFHIHISMF